MKIQHILTVMAAIPVFAAPQITLQQIKTGFKGEFCYVHARAGMTPDGKVILTAQPLFLKGTDVFYGLEMLKSNDGGKSWSSFQKSKTMVRQKYDAKREYVISDSSPFYHKKSGKLITTGHSAVYRKTVSPLLPGRAIPCGASLILLPATGKCRDSLKCRMRSCVSAAAPVPRRFWSCRTAIC